MRSALLVGVVAAGCGGSVEAPEPGIPELGVARFEASSADGALEIRGLAADGSVVVEVDLRTTTVRDGDNVGVGRALAIEIGGEGASTFESIGLHQIHLAPPDERLEPVLLHPYVARLLAEHGIVTGVEEPIAELVPGVETNYGHGGACNMSWDSWIPQCMGTGFTSCCMAHLNMYGYQSQLVVCGNAMPPARASRACFYPPSCSAGKVYGDTPVGCDQEAQTVCPAGTVATLITGTGKWQCMILSTTPTQCASKFLGGLGCATCWTTPNTSAVGTMWNAFSNTCMFVSKISAPVEVGILRPGEGFGSGGVKSDPDGIDCHFSGEPGDCLADYAPGKTIRLVATPDDGSVFVRWGGECEPFGAEPVCELTVKDSHYASAMFDERRK